MSSVPKVSKIAMKNIISSVKIHNRIVEEDECWRQRKLELSRERRTLAHSRSGGEKYRWKHNKAYMDLDSETEQKSYQGREPSSCNWIKLYDKIESTCPDRWGHAGYKELYPEQFLSTDDESENTVTQKANEAYIDGLSKENKERNLKSRKRKSTSDEESPVQKKKKSHKCSDSKKKKEKKKKKFKKRRRSSSVSSSSSSSPPPKKKKSKKKSKQK